MVATDWDVLEAQAVTRFDSCFFASCDLLTNLHVLGGQDVVVDAVWFFDTGDTGTAVRVIFDVFDSSFSTE